MLHHTNEPNDQLLTLSTQATSLQSIPVFVGRRVGEPTMKPIALGNLLQSIRTSVYLRNTIEDLRQESDNKERRKFKAKYLPYFTFTRCRDNYRNDDSLLGTKFMTFDLDHTAGRIDELFHALQQDPYVFLLFHSPSGDGLKIVIELEKEITTKDEYNTVYTMVRKRLEDQYKVRLDHTKDPSRACFLSYDPDTYLNDSHRCLSVTTTSEPQAKQAMAIDSTTNTSDKMEEVLDAFSAQDVGHRTHSLTRQIGIFIRQGFSREMALAAIRPWDQLNAEPLGEEKLAYTVNDMYTRYLKEERYERFWSYGNDVFEFGMAGDEFFMSSIGRRKFEILADAKTPEEREEVFEHLVRHKHLPYLKRVDHIGDVDATRSYYDVEAENGIVTVHYAACPEDIDDNQMIEDYLAATFGANASFVKEWLAVYVYSNYRKLPTILLKGPRGTGKNVFASFVMAIYPQLSQFWHGKEKNFTPEVEKKLLVADESISGDEAQYRMIKKYSGQDEHTVNQKYMKEYKVRNNMNIIILSNSERPIFVERMELPQNEKNNQFFVFRMHPFSGPVDIEFAEKLKKRLGHWIRTELKTVYDRVKDNTDCRYSIRTPITDEEKALFDLNKTDLDEEVDKVLDQMNGSQGREYQKFFEQGCFPKSYVANFGLPRGVTKNDIYRRLKERGYCETSDGVSDEPRTTIDKRRERCLLMTEKLKTWYKEQQKEAAKQ